MKIVLDTNVFISGIFWTGAPRRVLTLFAENKVSLMTTKNILYEYSRILHKIDRKGDVAEKWMTFILENSFIFEDTELVRICRDPEDDKFLNCAITGKADCIVSGDDDLLSIKKIEETVILDSVRFLKKYKELC